ncbi:KH domain-containing protein [bacterium]|nr:KH domain-containing protein [bacterium]
MDRRVLTGSDPDRLEAELREQFSGLDVLVWRVQGEDGETSVSAVPAHQVYEFIEEIALKVSRVIDRYSNVRVKPDRNERTRVLIIIHSREVGAFVGWHGQTLDAIELILSAVVSRSVGFRMDLTVDIDQYRKKRQSFLDALVRRTVREIELDHTERSLPNLLPKERRYVHTTMSEHPYLTTESRGRGSRRTIYIVPRTDLENKEP